MRNRVGNGGSPGGPGSGRTTWSCDLLRVGSNENATFGNSIEDISDLSHCAKG